MTTIDELVTRIERRLIDLPTAITTESITLVNEAIRAGCKRHNFYQMKAEVEATTVDLTRKLVNVPVRFKEQRDAPYLREGQDGNLGDRPLRMLASLEEARREYALTDTDDFGRPQAILREYDDDNTQDEFLVFPFPDTSSNWDDGLFRVVVPYWRYPAVLTTGQSNYFTDNWEEYLVNKATAEGFSIAWADVRASKWEKKADTEFKMLKNADKLSDLTRVSTLGVFRDVHSSKTQRRM